ncbi:hypothetical protein [Aeromicrobium piscarium]|uniref:Uncharacterized protein n=1 Tax=Aeromicrobium piscarium TaxID=2590901 RepID=A0A554RX58_9ACTN|nr:hypothetical protein [Aeromicrobium piscarium]TSD58681.1 hypothetical protein FNM00_13560 [Aeromicrobium piscarium]
MLAVGLAGPAFANHTSVTVGGSATPAGAVAVTGTNVTDIAFISDRGTELQCETSSITGNVLRGASVSVGNVVGSISSLNFSDCIAAGIFDVNVTMNTGDFTVVEHPAAAGDDVVVDIEVPSASITGTGCSFTASGTVRALIKEDATEDAIVELVPVDWNTMSGFDLNIAVGGSGSSCGGEVVNGDAAGANWVDEFTNPHEPQFAIDTNGAGAISHS